MSQLRCELATYPAELSDRSVAEEELAALDAMMREGLPEVPRLRSSLLLIASSLGSVSALGSSVTAVRAAIDQFGDVSHQRDHTREH
ncbi:hypothetical protein FHS42_003290 [Streptomyces zagrosensis]|uniref:Uncharacterized protein n=1 Tax=Streptomyces zagrosensis TaxID=1042984 RepID=A0A7W9Q9P0_9ACTN|nr:hypothetical protein [Streptomyces zagrosensis]